MAWDTARTRQALLYQYFGNKEKLFGHVLEAELDRIATTIPITVEQAADLGDYAGRLYDYHRSRPQFIRLLHWEGLRDKGAPALKEPERTVTYGARVEAHAQAQSDGTLGPTLDPRALFYAVLALGAWWFSVPQAVRMIFGGEQRPETERDALIALVRRLAGQGDR
ncbi:TetR family transcriptional regulator [Streptomyces durmitorensis]|uniref:HTH-type transcriptional repressor Sco4008 C-terminal domain-containing protein n=1 Tax=Streptomyces durmitorensis TaxID=319947 RepID=A0ABY4PQC4_9ACTN|nr:hypothetical protein [Streptomyces durmitorensis]UQT55203.1 hypothetical protein M4V62_08880 [Streptomyces durmitorensis]